MAMGRREAEQQQNLIVTHDKLPRSSGHMFYRKLNRLLAEGSFDVWIEGVCEPHYCRDQGRPSVPPGVNFRMLLGEPKRMTELPALPMVYVDWPNRAMRNPVQLNRQTTRKQRTASSLKRTRPMRTWPALLQHDWHFQRPYGQASWQGFERIRRRRLAALTTDGHLSTRRPELLPPCTSQRPLPPLAVKGGSERPLCF